MNSTALWYEFAEWIERESKWSTCPGHDYRTTSSFNLKKKTQCMSEHTFLPSCCHVLNMHFLFLSLSLYIRSTFYSHSYTNWCHYITSSITFNGNGHLLERSVRCSRRSTEWDYKLYRRTQISYHRLSGFKTKRLLRYAACSALSSFVKYLGCTAFWHNDVGRIWQVRKL